MTRTTPEQITALGPCWLYRHRTFVGLPNSSSIARYTGRWLGGYLVLQLLPTREQAYLDCPNQRLWLLSPTEARLLGILAGDLSL